VALTIFGGRGLDGPAADTVSTPIGSGSISGSDHVTYTYYCNGARATATDQRGVVHTYTYDDLSRLTADAATAVPGQTYSVDTAVLSIARTYDPNGALASVTSYDNTTGGSGHEVNQLKYTRDAWGNVTRSIQDPNGPAGDTDPNVAYTWGYGLSGDVASHARLEKVTLPGGREIYYNYEDANAFMSLGRVANIAANGSPTPGDMYVAYSYLGASIVVDADHPAVPTGLRLTYAGGASGDYSGLDPTSRRGRYARASRFGRVVWQRWLRTDGASAADRHFYPPRRTSGNPGAPGAERANASSAGGSSSRRTTAPARTWTLLPTRSTRYNTPTRPSGLWTRSTRSTRARWTVRRCTWTTPMTTPPTRTTG
jgi:YD repeat-containing protein